MLLCGKADSVAGRMVWLLGWVVFPVVWLTVEGLFPVVWAGGVMVGGDELGPMLGPTVASVTEVVCDLLGTARVVTRVWVIGLVDEVLFVVTREVVAGIFMVVWVVRVSELEVVKAI